MVIAGLRATLRESTREAHHKLDSSMEEFVSIDAYRSFALGSYWFRSCIEPALAGVDFWDIEPLVNHLAADLADLEICTGTAPGIFPELGDASSQLGALYVLEGSSVGARLLLRQAQKLGLGETYGARHLACQTGDATRWRRFVLLLDNFPDLDAQKSTLAAQRVFATAYSLFAKARNDLAHPA